MNYSIEVKESHICVNISGTVSLRSPSSWKEITSALVDTINCAKENKIFKLLIDCRGFIGKISMLDRFLLAVFFVKENSRLVIGKLHPLKVAFVLNESTIDPKRFGEMVARNRGLRGLVTVDIEEALQWLEQDTPSE